MTLVGIDVGTTGVKAIAISESGDVLGRAEEEYPLSIPQAGWAEQDPEDWWAATERALATLDAGDAPIGLTGQMHGLVLLDSADRVLRPAILWNDQRTGAECAEIEERIGLRAADRADGEPGADRVHGAEARLGPEARAGRMGAGGAHAPARRTTSGCG